MPKPRGNAITLDREIGTVALAILIVVIGVPIAVASRYLWSFVMNCIGRSERAAEIRSSTRQGLRSLFDRAVESQIACEVCDNQAPPGGLAKYYPEGQFVQVRTTRCGDCLLGTSSQLTHGTEDTLGMILAPLTGSSNTSPRNSYPAIANTLEYTHGKHSAFYRLALSLKDIENHRSPRREDE